VSLWVCYHDKSKLRASILTKLGLLVKVVTISSWLNFGRPAPPGRGSAVGRKFLAPPYYSQRSVFASHPRRRRTCRWVIYVYTLEFNVVNSFVQRLERAYPGRTYSGAWEQFRPFQSPPIQGSPWS